MKADTPTETLCHPFFDPLSKYRRMLPTDQFSSHERWRRRLLAWRNSGIRRYLEQNPDASLHKEDIDWGEPPMTNKLIESVRMRERQEQSKVLGSITLEKADVQQWRAAASSDGREANMYCSEFLGIVM